MTEDYALNLAGGHRAGAWRELAMDAGGGFQTAGPTA